MKHKSTWITCLTALAVFTQAEIGTAQTVLLVDVDAPGGGTGWQNAYTDLQAALDDAAPIPGDVEIHVAGGTYRPDTSGLGDPREASFSLLNTVKIMGGYAGYGEPDPDARDLDPLTNGTTLSGDIGVLGVASDNCYVVVKSTGNNTTAWLDGFTITGGYGGDALWADSGAGVLVGSYSSPTIKNCRIVGNQAWYWGGGAFVADGGSPRFENCTF